MGPIKFLTLVVLIAFNFFFPAAFFAAAFFAAAVAFFAAAAAAFVAAGQEGIQKQALRWVTEPGERLPLAVVMPQAVRTGGFAMALDRKGINL